LFPDWVEPAVDSNLRVVWEDEEIVAVHKPAPLPVHPSGRFNRNTVTSLLKLIYQPDDLRVVHRLDANTTGVLVFARTAEVATSLREQFGQNRIEKRYLVLCDGHPDEDFLVCDQSIAKQRGPAGSRSIDPDGHTARTEFHVLRRLGSGATLLEARPRTGRTHQIRIHLWSMRMPVIGDPAYLPDRQPAPTQTLSLSDPPMCLHAAGLRLNHPGSGKRIEIEAHTPNWLAQLE
jgi:RluA family pseudouridine synthase